MKSRLRPAATTLCGLLVAAASLPAVAGVFSVTPVRLYLNPRDRAIAVTVTNEGDTAVVLQADLNLWTQKPDGTDELVLTEDLILAPPILKLAPKAKQVVRLALLKPADPTRQTTYRMIIREVPEAQNSPDRVQLPIALALSMPVFVTPPNVRRAVDCSLQQVEPAGASVQCRNTGNAYAQVREASVRRGAQVLARFEGGHYILPGAAKSIALKSEQTLSPGAAELAVTFDDGQSIAQPITLP
jgi:fimbrial chaperone protein